MENTAFKEIAELKKEMHELKTEIERLNGICHIGFVLTRERDLDKLLPLVMTEISKAIDADRSTLFLVDWERMVLRSKFAENLEIDRIEVELKMGLVGLSVLSGKLINTANAYEDLRFNPEIDGKTGFRTESLISAPFFNNEGDVMGAVELLGKETGIFTKEDEKNVLKVTSMLTKINWDSEKDTDTAKKMVYELRKLTECKRGALFLLDRVNGELISVMAEGLEQDIHLSLNLGIAGLAAITGQELNIPDAYSDIRFDKRTDEKTGYRTRSLLCVPIKDQSDSVIGVIEVINKKTGVFSDSDMDLLKALSSIVAISVENAILLQEQNRQFRSLLEVLAASIDAKDHLTAGHSQKVTEYSVKIARELGFGESEIDILSVAALLHDYGKLGTDDNILKKSGKLTNEEFDHIKQHVANTRNILDKMYFMRKYRDVPLIASCHHERLDGSGYMNGLKEDKIPFMAKIIAVADVFEALTAQRNYREALSPEDAFEILEQNAGIKLDENIITALRKNWQKAIANESLQDRVMS
ncbi:MAG: GAF domain-containing protein [Desulfobacterales bacterium]|nr:MAG: GAF domain-containing protein [Desulfobacterales bacterium]